MLSNDSYLTGHCEGRETAVEGRRGGGCKESDGMRETYRVLTVTANQLTSQ